MTMRKLTPMGADAGMFEDSLPGGSFTDGEDGSSMLAAIGNNAVQRATENDARVQSDLESSGSSSGGGGGANEGGIVRTMQRNAEEERLQKVSDDKTDILDEERGASSHGKSKAIPDGGVGGSFRKTWFQRG